MDWSNERYVRLYANDTKTWKMFGWEGQSVFALLLRKVDRSGMLDDVFDGDDVALMLGGGFPVEIANTGLSRLIKRGTVEITNSGLLMINYIEAQETPKSDTQRQRDSRESKRAKAKMSVTKRDTGVTKRDTCVTNRDNMSRPVTACHTVSHPVTLTCADPVPSVPDPMLKKKSDSTTKKTAEKSQIRNLSSRYISIFNEVFSRNVKAVSAVEPKIAARLSPKNPSVPVMASWQILCAPILQAAMDPNTGSVRNFGPTMLLRDGTHARTSENGSTNGATDWLSKLYLSADKLVLDARLTAIAAHFWLTEDILQTGAKLTPIEKEAL